MTEYKRGDKIKLPGLLCHYTYVAPAAGLVSDVIEADEHDHILMTSAGNVTVVTEYQGDAWKVVKPFFQESHTYADGGSVGTRYKVHHVWESEGKHYASCTTFMERDGVWRPSSAFVLTAEDYEGLMDLTAQ